MDGESHVRRFRLAQPGVIAAVAAGLAIRQVLRKIRGLSKCQNRPEAETGYLRTKNFLKLVFMFVPLRAIEESDCSRSVYHQLLTVLQLQEMNVSKICSPCTFAVS